MENWKQKPLSQVVSRWIRGTTLNRSRADYYTKTPGPESLPWARVGDMKEGLLCETENYLTKEGVDQIPGGSQCQRALCCFLYQEPLEKVLLQAAIW